MRRMPRSGCLRSSSTSAVLAEESRDVPAPVGRDEPVVGLLAHVRRNFLTCGCRGSRCVDDPDLARVEEARDEAPPGASAMPTTFDALAVLAEVGHLGQQLERLGVEDLDASRLVVLRRDERPSG